MKSSPFILPLALRTGLAVVALAALPHANVSAQDALRDSLAGESAAALKRYARENQPYNLKLGDLKLLVDASLQVEANDNVNLVHSGAQADVILRPKISVAGTWPVTPLNSLDLSVGLGYAKYLEHGQYDQLLIQPGSALAFDFFAGDWRINLHDRFSYSQDPLQNGSVSGTAQYGGLNNALGFSADWDLRDVVLTVGFDHLNFISSTKRYSYVDHRAEQALGRASIQLHPAVKAGLEASGGPTDYAQPILSDNLNYSVGPFVGWQVDAHLNLELRGGFVGYTFVPNSGLQNLPDSSSYYFLLQLQHTPSETISHSLEAGRELSSGINANLIDLWHVRHQGTWRILHHYALNSQLFYEHGRDSNLVVGEAYDRFGFGLGISRSLNQKLSARLAYGVTIKRSSQPVNAYTQNSVTLELGYRF